ncbi:MAG: NADH:ubiquinone oxidoreductase subunit K, partial [Planctomycetota bacterium]
MGVEAYVAVAVALFSLGVICIISRRNILYVLMGIEMIL